MPTNPGKSSVSAIVGARIAAVGASVCCVVPLALVLLGISGAWIGNLTALDPWRPWLSAAALIARGLAFWHGREDVVLGSRGSVRGDVGCRAICKKEKICNHKTE